MGEVKCNAYGGAPLQNEHFIPPISEAIRCEADVTKMLHAAGCCNCEVTSEDRARQFMPFAALTGYYDLVKDTEERDAKAFEVFREKIFDDIPCSEGN